MAVKLDVGDDGSQSLKIYGFLAGETIYLRQLYTDYELLFMESKKRVDLLSRSGSSFWARIQEALLNHVLLTSCRICERSSIGGYDNLSIPGLIEALRLEGKKEVCETVRNAFGSTHELVERARDHRRKRIAHMDLKYTLAEDPSILPTITLQDIHRLIEGIESVIQIAHDSMLDRDLMLGKDMADRRVNDLFTMLCKGKVFEDLVRARKVEDSLWRSLYQEIERDGS